MSKGSYVRLVERKEVEDPSSPQNKFEESPDELFEEMRMFPLSNFMDVSTVEEKVSKNFLGFVVVLGGGFFSFLAPEFLSGLVWVSMLAWLQWALREHIKEDAEVEDHVNKHSADNRFMYLIDRPQDKKTKESDGDIQVTISQGWCVTCSEVIAKIAFGLGSIFLFFFVLYEVNEVLFWVLIFGFSYCCLLTPIFLCCKRCCEYFRKQQVSPEDEINGKDEATDDLENRRSQQSVSQTTKVELRRMKLWEVLQRQKTEEDDELLKLDGLENKLRGLLKYRIKNSLISKALSRSKDASPFYHIVGQTDKSYADLDEVSDARSPLYSASLGAATLLTILPSGLFFGFLFLSNRHGPQGEEDFVCFMSLSFTILSFVLCTATMNIILDTFAKFLGLFQKLNWFRDLTSNEGLGSLDLDLDGSTLLSVDGRFKQLVMDMNGQETAVTKHSMMIIESNQKTWLMLRDYLKVRSIALMPLIETVLLGSVGVVLSSVGTMWFLYVVESSEGRFPRPLKYPPMAASILGVVIFGSIAVFCIKLCVMTNKEFDTHNDVVAQNKESFLRRHKMMAMTCISDDIATDVDSIIKTQSDEYKPFNRYLSTELQISRISDLMDTVIQKIETKDVPIRLFGLKVDSKFVNTILLALASIGGTYLSSKAKQPLKLMMACYTDKYDGQLKKLYSHAPFTCMFEMLTQMDISPYSGYDWEHDPHHLE